MSQTKRWLVLFALLGAIAAIGQWHRGGGGGLVSTAEAAFPGPDALVATSQQCLPSGRVRVNFSWTSYNSGPQWIDLSLANNGFAPNTFLGLGPMPASQNQFTWEGLLPGLPHFVRINGLVGGFWYSSNTLAFLTMPCGTSGSNAPGADNLALVSQACIDGGRTRATVGWTTNNGGAQWLDLSIFNNGFAPGTFVGIGPFPATQTQQTWDGLLSGVTHYMRLNTLAPAGWYPSNTITFTTPSCTDGFTTANKTVTGNTSAQVTLINVAFGAHPDENFDRLVYTFTGGIPSATVQYGGQSLACGSGNPVPIQGATLMKARFASTVAHNDNGQVTVNTTQVAGSPEAKQICDFEGVVEWAIGTDSVAPFRVTTLANPFRIVIDVRR